MLGYNLSNEKDIWRQLEHQLVTYDAKYIYAMIPICALFYHSIQSRVECYCTAEVKYLHISHVHSFTSQQRLSKGQGSCEISFFIHCHIKRNSKSQVPVGLVSFHRLLQTGDQFEIPTISSPHTTNTPLSMFTFYFIFQEQVKKSIRMERTIL